MSLFYPHRSKPFQGVAAFAHIGEDTTPSQAAVPLSLGAQLRGGHAPLQARAAALRRKGYVAVEPEQAFPVPRLRGVDGPIPFDESRARLKRLHGYTPRARRVAAADEGRYAVAYRDCAQHLFDKPVAANAADLFALCLDHPRALARIAAAIASLPLTSRPEENLKALVQGVQSDDELERELAATGLARYAPVHPALRRFARVKPARRVSKPPETLMLVHGTFAPDQPWYQPGGDFHTFVAGLRNDLYDLPDAELGADAAGIALTFDDGYQDVLELAIPELERRGWPATVFVVPGAIAGDVHFDWYPAGEMPPLIGWDDMRSVEARSTIRFEPHTMTHPILPRVSREQAEHEIRESKRVVEHELGREARLFCYPAGYHSTRDVQLVREAGFRAALTCEFGANRIPFAEPFELRRTIVEASDPLWVFSGRLDGATDRAPLGRRSRRVETSL